VKIKNIQGAVWVILFGVGITIASLLTLNFANSANAMGVLFGFLSAYLLDYFFWDTFIGKSTFYRARNITGPLVVAGCILGLLILAAILTMQH
jgi:hypothetical protein